MTTAETTADRPLVSTHRCAHCGDPVPPGPITHAEKAFCCSGCFTVYKLLDRSGLCGYYDYNEMPGRSLKQKARKDKFAFLDDAAIASRLIVYTDAEQTRANFYLPHIHCSSCLYLLENLNRLDERVISSTVAFGPKECTVAFAAPMTLREVAELLTDVGYEPYICLNQLDGKKQVSTPTLVYRIGVAGFCFANIMLMSFPEYLGLDASEISLRPIFRTLNFLLSLPVFLYAAFPFYQSAWKGLANRFLNIDAPIAMAIIVTFARSVYEIATGSGGGYLDSMSGIVFFMLVGRSLQDRTQEALSFDRDYMSYFPIAVNTVHDGKLVPTALPDIKPGDTMRLHNEEIIPADGILTKGMATIDYGFVTGESVPIAKEMGEIVYAGGKQKGGAIEVLAMKQVSQSYLTELWAKEGMDKEAEKDKPSFVHFLSKWFTYMLLLIAGATLIYWGHEGKMARGLSAVSTLLIVACPCALLLSSTFANGNLLKILGLNKCYLRSSLVIESLASINHIVFDKTGTLTTSSGQSVAYQGNAISPSTMLELASVVKQSSHPLDKLLLEHIEKQPENQLSVSLPLVGSFQRYIGKGIAAEVGNKKYRLGSFAFVTGKTNVAVNNRTETYLSIDGVAIGKFVFSNRYRAGVELLVKKLAKKYEFSVLSGDNPGETERLRTMMGPDSDLLFQQSPHDKLRYMETLKQVGKRPLMIGDGLNDAGALKKSTVGLAVAENCNNFTPACDAIVDADRLTDLPKFIRLCKANGNIVRASFVMSIAYNVVGLSFAVQGNLSPLIAAILMPISSLSIFLLTYGSTTLYAKILGLKTTS